MKIRLDISGPKGNAFYILGLVKTLAKNETVATSIRNEMKKGDYNHLLRTFKSYFPIVTLYSPHKIESVDDDCYEIIVSDIIEL